MNLIGAYKFFLKQISREKKKKLIILTFFSQVLSVLEFLSIILIYPFIVSLQNLDTKDPDILKIYSLRDYLGLSNDNFITLLLFLIIGFYIIFNLCNLIVLYKFSYYWSRIIGELQAKVFNYYTNLVLFGM